MIRSASAPKILILVLGLAGLGLTACAEQQTATTGGADTATTDTATADTAMGPAGPSAGTVVQVAQNDTLGAYLTDADGRALYLFLKDEQDSGESTCYDACAGAWPPFTAEQGAPSVSGAAADSLLSTFERRDGSMQVAYNGWPLYYFAKDQGSGQLEGQDIEGFGAEWYLVTPQGTEVHANS